MLWLIFSVQLVNICCFFSFIACFVINTFAFFSPFFFLRMASAGSQQNMTLLICIWKFCVSMNGSTNTKTSLLCGNPALQRDHCTYISINCMMEKKQIANYSLHRKSTKIWLSFHRKANHIQMCEYKMEMEMEMNMKNNND